MRNFIGSAIVDYKTGYQQLELENTDTASHGKRSGGEETAVAIGSNYRNAMEII